MSRFRYQTGSIIGRVDDIRTIRETLSGARLVTLVGPGGVGKTTLAAEVVQEIEPEFDRVVLVELADVVDEAELNSRMVAALSPGQAMVDGALDDERLVAALGVSSTLLVLDNCEHLVDEVARLVGVALTAEPRVTALTTSRRPLELAEEVLWTVRPLEVPDDPGVGEETGPDRGEHSGLGSDDRRLTDSPSVQLFLERTRQAVPAFSLTSSNRHVVARICVASDGIPLVLELAAALVRTRPLDQILVAMTEHPAGLGTGRRDRAQHQRSLLASLDWSRQFLDEQDAELLNRLAVFVGGFTVDGARLVDPAGTADGLARLVDHSLVEFDPQTGRYYLLEVVRVDAVGRLDADGLAAAQHGHTEACLEIVARIERDALAADPDGVFHRFEWELPNLAAALRRAETAQDRSTFQALLGPIAVWWVHGLAPTDPRTWEDAVPAPNIEAADDLTDAERKLVRWRGNILHALAFYWSHRGHHRRALDYATEAEVFHRAAGRQAQQSLDRLSAGNALLSLD
ncbi:MAG: NB-ARC domain-containing protein, partial [Actinomycetota bacterium]